MKGYNIPKVLAALTDQIDEALAQSQRNPGHHRDRFCLVGTKQPRGWYTYQNVARRYQNAGQPREFKRAVEERLKWIWYLQQLLNQGHKKRHFTNKEYTEFIYRLRLPESLFYNPSWSEKASLCLTYAHVPFRLLKLLLDWDSITDTLNAQYIPT